ncbi:unnamed protein product [Amoebophrya sp. A25]|nr:unnamed protein product [Amoebophrya sp. A25]|eukprot:GSA25T00021018001.1
MFGFSLRIMSTSRSTTPAPLSVTKSLCVLCEKYAMVVQQCAVSLHGVVTHCEGYLLNHC